MKSKRLKQMRTALPACLLAFLISTQISCMPKDMAAQSDPNPLARVDVEDIAIARFTGMSSPVEGIYFETDDPDIIKLIYDQFRVLQPNNPHIISMAGNLTTLHLLDRDETIISEIEINGDASTIVVRGRRESVEDFLMTESPETALFTFDFLKKNAPEMMAKLKASDSREVELLHKKNYPINE